MNYLKGVAFAVMVALGMNAYGKDPHVHRYTDELGNKGFRVDLGEAFSDSSAFAKRNAAEDVLSAELARAGLKTRYAKGPKSVEGNNVYIHPWYTSRKHAKLTESMTEPDF
jgi:hypothetical protein